MQLATIRQKVNRRVGISLSTDTVTDIINDALSVFSMERDWPWLAASDSVTWVNGDTTTASPVRARVITGVNVGGYDYPPIPWIDAAVYNTDSERATGYAEREGLIAIVPTPNSDTAITVFYLQTEDALVNNTDEPLVPDAYIPAVIALACAMCHDRPDGDEKARSRFMERYTQLLRTTEKAALRRKKGPGQRPSNRWDIP